MTYRPFLYGDEKPAGDDLLTPTSGETYGGGPNGGPEGGVGQFGGVEGVYSDDPYGKGQTGRGSAQGEADRSRRIASESDTRGAYQLQFGKALANEQNNVGARQQQLQAQGLLRSAALGGAPSRAEIESGQVANNSLEGALATTAGQRRGGQAGQTIGAQAGQQLQGAAQGIGARSQEMGAARGGLIGANQTIRAGDYSAQGLAQQRAIAQGRMQTAQERLNDARKMAYEQRGFGALKAQQEGQLSREEIEAQRSGAAARANEAEHASQQDTVWKAVGFGSKLSDKRAKAKAKLPTKLDAAISQSRDNEPLKYGENPYGDWGKPTDVNTIRGGHQVYGNETTPRTGEGEPDVVSGGRQRQSLDEAMAKASGGGGLESSHWGEDSAANTRAALRQEDTRERPLFGPGHLTEGTRHGDYARSRAQQPGGMFGADDRPVDAPAPEADYGDLRSYVGGSERDTSAGLAPGSHDLAFGEGKKLSADDEQISLSDEAAKKAAFLAGADYGAEIASPGKMAKEGRIAPGVQDRTRRAATKNVPIGEMSNETVAEVEAADRAQAEREGRSYGALFREGTDDQGTPRTNTVPTDRFNKRLTYTKPTSPPPPPAVPTTPLMDPDEQTMVASRLTGNRITGNTSDKSAKDAARLEGYNQGQAEAAVPKDAGKRFDANRAQAARMSPAPDPSESVDQREQRYQEKAKLLEMIKNPPGLTNSSRESKVGGSVEDPELQRGANRALQGETYRYKRGFGEDTQQVHHGQMAQTMEQNPISATAVREDPSGLKKVDTIDKLNVTASGVAQLQEDQDEMAHALAKLAGRRKRA